MKNSIFNSILLAGAVLGGLTACEDSRNAYLEDYQTMVYFRNGGQQEISVYQTGEDAYYSVPVCKAGRNLSGTVSVELMAFDEVQLEAYNYAKETDYKLIPSRYFSVETVDGTPVTLPYAFDFAADESYKLFRVKIDPEAVGKLMSEYPEDQFVIGLQLFSTGKVSQDINLILVSPAVATPKVGFLKSGVEKFTYSSASPRENLYSNTVTLNMEENRWDFTCDIAVKDQAWLDDYNLVHNTAYTVLPASMYKLSTTQLSFEKGKTDVSFDIEVSRSGMDLFKEYAIPVVFTACSKEEFFIDEETSVYLVNVRLDPDQVALTEDMVSVSHAETSEGQKASYLVDGKLDTYWHSPWSVAVDNPDPVYGIYVDIKLMSELRAFVMHYWVRHSNDNCKPRLVVFGVSNDGLTWTKLGEAETEEMAAAGKGDEVTLPVFTSPTPFRYLRMGIAKSGAAATDLRVAGSAGSAALAEIQLYGTEN